MTQIIILKELFFFSFFFHFKNKIPYFYDLEILTIHHLAVQKKYFVLTLLFDWCKFTPN
jgi:hypothetical protein